MTSFDLSSLTTDKLKILVDLGPLSGDLGRTVEAIARAASTEWERRILMQTGVPDPPESQALSIPLMCAYDFGAAMRVLLRLLLETDDTSFARTVHQILTLVVNRFVESTVHVETMLQARSVDDLEFPDCDLTN